MPVISGSNKKSGFLNLSARLQIREKDSRGGSYPTILKIGDQDFQGNFKIFFDDTNTINFDQNSAVSYPTLLNQESPLINEIISSPNENSDILINSSLRKGISDDFYFKKDKNSESISAFKEHIIPIDNSNSFFNVGTKKDIIENFDFRLGSKTIIKIPLNPVSGSSVFWSTGTLPNATGTNDGVNSGISYFNFENKTWEPLGVTEFSGSGNSVDYINAAERIRKESYLANMTSETGFDFEEILNENILNELFSYSGFPCSTIGFPNANKFDQEQSKTIKLKNYINKPFLIEKVLFHWTGSINLNPFVALPGYFPERSTICLINQFKNSDKSEKFETNSIVRRKEPITGTINASYQYETGKLKEIISFGRIQIFYESVPQENLNVPGFYPSGYYAELNLKSENSYPSGISKGVTGSFNLEMKTGVLNEIKSTSAFNLLDGDRQGFEPGIDSRDLWQFLGWGGGRTGLGFNLPQSGRSFIRPFIGEKIASSSFANVSTGSAVSWLNQISFNVGENSFFDSPYLVFPDDELILAAINQGKSELQEELIQKTYTMNFAPGESYILLFGSEIVDNKEYHDTSNQPLDSDSVHQVLSFNSPTIDQWQVEPRLQYSGSYIDYAMSGSAQTLNRVAQSILGGNTSNLSGSLLKGVRVIDTQKRFYDSMTPSIYDLYKKDLGVSASNNGVFIASPFMDYPDSSFNKNWLAEFPYNNNLKRNSDPTKFQENSLLASLGLSLNTSSSGSMSGSIAVFTKNANVPVEYPNTNEILKFWFGIGDSKIIKLGGTTAFSSNLIFGNQFPNISYVGAGVSAVFKLDNIRGFKYGILNCVPYNSSHVFRHDSYGQFRDLLEQSYDTVFYDEKKLDYPIKSIFINHVSSSNKSVFSTSSLPYFDEEARN